MAKWSGREKFWSVLAAPIAVVVVFWIGPAYLIPLPTWLQLAIAVAGACFVATVAVVSRRRARRGSRPSNLV